MNLMMAYSPNTAFPTNCEYPLTDSPNNFQTFLGCTLMVSNPTCYNTTAPLASPSHYIRGQLTPAPVPPLLELTGAADPPSYRQTPPRFR